ncbi:hypothetical protein B0H63DRAFT_519182 [Podospora didyma]|uniref:Uncharacterized protein n=1 Tax=Podospora didyma TaxID=330526 RepID=A0AAE0NYE1_9PEZI|nr:hypothetical protein B0H63DRAFT_519182 [Podospora didyma]
MTPRFSSVVGPSLYTDQTYGLCDGLEVRLHNDNVLDDLGVLMAQKDWRDSVGPLQKRMHTSMSRASNIMISMTLGAYMKAEETLEAGRENGAEEILVMGDNCGAQQSSTFLRGQHRQLLVKGIQKMLAIDPVNARRIMIALNDRAEVASNRNCTSCVHFKSLEEYVTFRVDEDIGMK